MSPFFSIDRDAWSRALSSAKAVAGRVFDRKDRLEHADLKGQIDAIGRSQAVIQFTLDGHVLDANPNFLQVMGYSLEQVRGQHHGLFVEPAYRQSAEYQQFWNKLGRGEYDAGQYKRVGKDGREVWLQASYNPIFDTGGRPFKIVKYAADVTRQKLREAEFEGQVAAISKAQAVIEFGMDGSILAANDNFLRVVGYRLNEISGQHHRMFVEPAYRQSADYQQLWEKLGRGEYDAGQYKRVAKGGREVWLQASYNPIFDMNGKPFKVVKYATDVTGQVLAVKQTQDVVVAARHGDLDQRIPLDGKTGAVRDLCEGVNCLVENMSAVVVDVGRVFGALAEGDLTQTIETEYQGAFQKIKQ
ncbi:MAG: methyl-accepting chemotaxis protein, partial [Hydrocarboniphaga sp.]|uniref:PAS domain-containing protein n=1 Tax=Hydrocarboniphaga sp. TaxID=2033016 RepID=UPI002629E019